MSRSRKKTAITGIAKAESEKRDKRIANRGNRRMNRRILSGGGVDLLHVRETSSVWLMSKDGKRPFDPLRYPELMRK